MLVQWLTRRGHQAFAMTGGTNVVHWIAHHKCDAVLIDHVLRDGDGLSLIAPIRKASPKTRVILMSGRHESDLESRALLEGASHCFPKPIDFGVLAAALDSRTAT